MSTGSELLSDVQSGGAIWWMLMGWWPVCWSDLY